MKKSLLVFYRLFMVVILLLPEASFSQGIGIGTTAPDASAALDITTANKGLLIPRMNITSINAIVNPAKGLLVYDSVANQLMANAGTPALPNWQSVASGSSGNGWNLNGNNGINPNNQFIGNTDNQPLRFRINNIQAGELHPVTGNIFWGLSAGSTNSAGFSNIAIGSGALKSNTVSSNLVAIGDSALFNNGLGNPLSDEATFNTAIGSKSLFANTTGTKNTAIGYRSLFSNDVGGFNTSTGYQTLFSNTTGVNNTSAGFSSLFSNVTGSDNTAIGNLSLFSSNGSFNTAVGNESLFTNSTGRDNTAIGFKALFSNTTATGNTAVGSLALNTNTIGSGNTALGKSALSTNTTGSVNTAVGLDALLQNLSGFDNTAVGGGALKFNTTGGGSTAIGSNTLLSNTTGISNTGIGFSALKENTVGFKNAALGTDALRGNTGGSQNTALGESALRFNTVGNSNVAVGTATLLRATDASENTAIGLNAGSGFSIGSFNVFIGSNADATSNNLFNSVALGQDAKVTANNQVRFGSPTTTSIGGFVGFSALSDGRFKKNIQDGVKGLEFIMKLRPVTYQLDVAGLNKKLNINTTYKTNSLTKNGASENEKTIFSGFVAQDVELAAQQAGYDFSGIDKPKNENDVYGLRYADFVVPLVKAIQEQQQTIFELKKQHADLLKRILVLEKIK